MTADLIPFERLDKARRRRALIRSVEALRAIEAHLAVMKTCAMDVDRRLRRVTSLLRFVSRRHDAYQQLIARCQAAANGADPEDMIRLRDAILRDHRALVRRRL